MITIIFYLNDLLASVFKILFNVDDEFMGVVEFEVVTFLDGYFIFIRCFEGTLWIDDVFLGSGQWSNGTRICVGVFED